MSLASAPRSCEVDDNLELTSVSFKAKQDKLFVNIFFGFRCRDGIDTSPRVG